DRPRGGKGLHPGTGPVPAGRRDTPTRSSAAGAVAVLYSAGRVADGAGTGRATPEPRPAGPGASPFPRSPPGRGESVALAGGTAHDPRGLGARDCLLYARAGTNT